MHSFLLKRVLHTHPCLVLLLKILILAAQIVQNFQHKGKQLRGLPFLGKGPREKISAWARLSLKLEDLHQHVGWWSFCLTSLLFKIPLVALWSYVRDDIVYLSLEERLDVILLPLAVCGSLISQCDSWGIHNYSQEIFYLNYYCFDGINDQIWASAQSRYMNCA